MSSVSQFLVVTKHVSLLELLLPVSITFFKVTFLTHFTIIKKKNWKIIGIGVQDSFCQMII